jgi:ParB family transcriptional regulator, chromosome partitioning protein
MRRGLGKGLGTLLGDAMGPETQGDVRQVPPWQISLNPFQPRKSFDDARLEELVQSVREHGILQPLLVRRGEAVDTFDLVAGERRLRAAQLLGLQSVPVIIKDYEDPQMLEVALIENIQREDISSVEAAMAYRKLMERFGFTQETIAHRVGKARSTVANTLRLLALPEPVLESLGRGEITEGHARAILQAPPEAQVELWQAAVTRRLRAHDLEKMAREMQREPVRTPGKQKGSAESKQIDPNLAAIESALREALGTKVTVKQSGDVGRIEIEFYDGQQLEGLVERLTGGL